MSEVARHKEFPTKSLRFSYQPLVSIPLRKPFHRLHRRDVENLGIVSYEALLKGSDEGRFPKNALHEIKTSPDTFNEKSFQLILEETGLVKNIGSRPPLPLQVNFDSVQITNNFPAMISRFADELVETGVWSGLIIELTERGAINQARVELLNRALQGSGHIIGISIDDVPAGNSVAKLQILLGQGVPIREIKLARNYKWEQVLALIRALKPSLLKEADFVAEGIISLDQLNTIVRIATDFGVQRLIGQGNLFSRPIFLPFLK